MHRIYPAISASNFYVGKWTARSHRATLCRCRGWSCIETARPWYGKYWNPICWWSKCVYGPQLFSTAATITCYWSRVMGYPMPNFLALIIWLKLNPIDIVGNIKRVTVLEHATNEERGLRLERFELQKLRRPLADCCYDLCVHFDWDFKIECTFDELKRN